MSKFKLSWRTNQEISAPQLRVVDSEGKQIGVLSKGEAIDKAKEQGLDLVEIAPKASPPVAKIVNFGKFRYQEEKKLKKEVKKTKGGELKEIRFSPFIAKGDYNTRLSRIREFLADKNKVRIVVVFLGRQMNSKKFGYELIKQIISDLDGSAVMEVDPKFLGRHLSTTISPVKFKAKKEEGDKNAEIQNQKISSEKI